MKTAARFSFIFLLFLVAACVPLTQKTADVSEPTLIQETAIPTPYSGLTVQKLQNMSLIAPNSGIPVQLTEGIYADETLSVTLLPQMTIGDLNGDQVDDAVVLMAENDGGTGTFVSMLVITNQNGQFLQVGSALIDDRPMIQSLTIVDGSIKLEAAIHGINDPMVSPTLAVVQTYKLLESNLVLVALTSTLPGGTERSISIDAPVDGSVVSGTVQLKGSMPAAPFENNLSLRIIDLTGMEYFSGGFMVTSADVGEPATFDNEIALPFIPIGTWVRLELAELSMADGSMVDMDSVLVKIK